MCEEKMGSGAVMNSPPLSADTDPIEPVTDTVGIGRSATPSVNDLEIFLGARPFLAIAEAVFGSTKAEAYSYPFSAVPRQKRRVGGRAVDLATGQLIGAARTNNQ